MQPLIGPLGDLGEESLITSTAAAAAEFISRSGVELIGADARLSGERKRIPFLHLARLHDLTVLDATDSNDTRRYWRGSAGEADPQAPYRLTFRRG